MNKNSKKIQSFKFNQEMIDQLEIASKSFKSKTAVVEAALEQFFANAKIPA